MRWWPLLAFAALVLVAVCAEPVVGGLGSPHFLLFDVYMAGLFCVLGFFCKLYSNCMPWFSNVIPNISTIDKLYQNISSITIKTGRPGPTPPEILYMSVYCCIYFDVLYIPWYILYKVAIRCCVQTTPRNDLIECYGLFTEHLKIY